MEREILFRAKRVDNGKWVYGSLIKSEEFYGKMRKEPKYYICPFETTFEYDECFNDSVEVNAETRGQYTGVKDKNGRKIFENDVIYFKEENMKGLINYRYGGWYITWYGYVQVCNGIGWEEKYTECNEESLYSNCLNEEDKIPYEIIGNIYDNKELIKE